MAAPFLPASGHIARGTPRHPAASMPSAPVRAALATLVAVTGTIALASITVATAPPAAAANWAPAQRGRLPRPEHPLFGRHLLRILHAELRAGGQDDQHPGVDLERRGHLEPPERLGRVAQPPVLGRGGEHVGTERRLRQHQQRLRHVLRGHRRRERRPVHRSRHVDAFRSAPTSTTAPRPSCARTGTYPFPVVDNGNLGGSIDPDVFTDNSGSSWLIWKSDGNHIGTNTYIWSIPLTGDYVPVATDSPTQLLTARRSVAERDRRGPRHVRDTDAPTPTTSSTPRARWAPRRTASAGPAARSGPAAPCQDESGSGPLLGTQPGVSGPGGPDVYTLLGRADRPGLRRLAGHHHRLPELRIPAHVPGRPVLRRAARRPPVLSPNDPNEAAAASPSCPQPPVPSPGYWQVAADGGVFTFGSAGFYGSTGSMRLNKPVVGMAVTPDRHGYWLVASDGGVFAFGDAGFYGSTGSMVLNKPIVGMIPTLDGRGYWLIASDGGVFAFGDAHVLRIRRRRQPRVPRHGGRAVLPRRRLLDGGLERSGLQLRQRALRGPTAVRPGWLPRHGHGGDAQLERVLAGQRERQRRHLRQRGELRIRGRDGAQRARSSACPRPIDGNGYWLQGADGGIFTFGDAPFLGSMGGLHLNAPMVGIAGV